MPRKTSQTQRTKQLRLTEVIPEKSCNMLHIWCCLCLGSFHSFFLFLFLFLGEGFEECLTSLLFGRHVIISILTLEDISYSKQPFAILGDRPEEVLQICRSVYVLPGGKVFCKNGIPGEVWIPCAWGSCGLGQEDAGSRWNTLWSFLTHVMSHHSADAQGPVSPFCKPREGSQSRALKLPVHL